MDPGESVTEEESPLFSLSSPHPERADVGYFSYWSGGAVIRIR